MCDGGLLSLSLSLSLPVFLPLTLSYSLCSILLVGRRLQMDSTAPFSGMDLRYGWSMDRGPSVDVLRACDGGDGGGDDQKDQRTMKTLGRDIVGSLSLSLSLSLSWPSLPLYGFVSSAAAAVRASYVAAEAHSYILQPYMTAILPNHGVGIGSVEWAHP